MAKVKIKEKIIDLTTYKVVVDSIDAMKKLKDLDKAIKSFTKISDKKLNLTINIKTYYGKQD